MKWSVQLYVGGTVFKEEVQAVNRNDAIETVVPSIDLLMNTALTYTVGSRVYTKTTLAEGTIRQITTGAGGDIQQVASMARQMVTRFGMSDKLGPEALGRSQGGMFLGRDIAAERDF